MLLLSMIGYLLFSSTFLDFLIKIFLFLFPSYRTFQQLKNPNIEKARLVEIVKLWVLISFYATIDLLIGNLIPLGFFLKGIILIQCVASQCPRTIDFIYNKIIDPTYTYLEQSDYFQYLNQFCSQLSNRN
ncbi:hypothetical protein NH340_JMT03316 [Sarcoptes scabiei]|nr:hypothetical protein NH340_JMT03316 [Sarcoptes scabiei]